MQKFGEEFWKTTSDNLTEVTRQVESKIGLKIKMPAFFGIDAGCDIGQDVSESEKEKIKEKAQSFIREDQVARLAEITDLIERILRDENKKTFMVIDKLDENWVDSSVKMRLILSLLETVNKLQGLRNLKIVVALRYDLVERVFQIAQPGMQREKYDSIFLHLRWTPHLLEQMLSRRVNHLVRSRYSKTQEVMFEEIIAPKVDRYRGVEWILRRSLYRPRDVIAYVNCCIERSSGKPNLTADVLKNVEENYSQNRLAALIDEWILEYPRLKSSIRILKNRPCSFFVKDLSTDEINEFLIDNFDACVEGKDLSFDEIGQAVQNFYRNENNIQFCSKIMFILYKIGLIGLKSSAKDPWKFSYEEDKWVSEKEIVGETKISVHTCFAKALNIVEDSSYTLA